MTTFIFVDSIIELIIAKSCRYGSIVREPREVAGNQMARYSRMNKADVPILFPTRSPILFNIRLIALLSR